MKLEVYDPAMCCSGGTCGPNVDPVLVRFAADLDWLKANGVEVARFNLSQQPEAFAANTTVLNVIREKGVHQLPVFFVNGSLAGLGSYPSRKQLALLTGLNSSSDTGARTTGGSCGCGPEGCCS
jgi:hypothetical protein